MADKVNDGGPAFPTTEDNANSVGTPYACRGMSLRDWFAGQAMAGLVAHYGTPNGAKVRAIPERAYEIADTMLKVRSE